MLKALKLPAVGEFGVVGMVVAIISLMVLPLPPPIIDALLAINIAISVTILMITLHIPNILSLSTFPSLLLFTTLYRLSLNIASTKSILLHAQAGHIIDSFGRLVVGGNLVVGLVVFVIITTVQFIVIAKGSERVAEVGARFTLDGMPGKQLSIDADLRNNLLTPDEAKRKRAKLAIESQLHGGMDGAMKFVKGDAIAGLIITVVNIVAGIAVGISYHAMTAGEAANRFSVLSIGDAMVSQIPSLLLSVAAGVMITRVEDQTAVKQSSVGEEMGHQLSTNSNALFFSALLLLGFAVVPGFPSALFVLLAGALSFAGYKLRQEKSPISGRELGTTPVNAMQRSGSKVDTPAILDRAPNFSSPVGVRLAPDLALRLSNESLQQGFDVERAQLQDRLGLPFPGITMWISDKLAPSHCEILLFDVPQLMMELPAGQVMLPDVRADAEGRPIDAAAIAGKLVARRGQGLGSDATPSFWIDQGGAPPDARAWNPEQVIAHFCIQLMGRNASQFLGVQEVQWILDQLMTDYPTLIAELQKVLPPQRIADVLRRLLEEQIPIRNARGIVESLITWGAKEKDMLMLTEYVRGDLSRYLAHRAADGERELSAVLLDLPVEQHIRGAIKQTPTGNFLALSPDAAAYLIDSIESFANAGAGKPVALVTSMDIRRYMRRLIAARLPQLPVYSYQELGEHVELKPVGTVAM
ncbi:MAG: type III secretion system export apparatus subunit SctV [Burkholderiaceae bacterium]